MLTSRFGVMRLGSPPGESFRSNVLRRPTSWARPPGCDVDTCAPANASDYARFAAAAAARYRGRIDVWELWNEPNSRVFWKLAPDALAYTNLLRASYAAIKTASPDATVLTGGTAPAANRSDAQGVVTVSPVSFLAGIYDAGGHGSFDAVAHHPYGYPNLPGYAGAQDAWYEMYGGSNSLRALMVANGDADKRIWATEFGAHTDPQGIGSGCRVGYLDLTQKTGQTRTYEIRPRK